MSNEDDALCVLNNVLWVPSEYVEPEAEEEFTYRFEEVEYQPMVDLPTQCANCDLWGKKWRPGRVTCESKGYTLDDVCKHFTHKKLPVTKEIVLRTYARREDGWTTFARGNMGKINRVFGHLGIDDQRVAPKLGFKLKCHRKLYPEQQEVANVWLKKGYGIIQAPTGWGKTVVWAWLVAKMGFRVLLLAQEVRHLMVGFEGLYEHTNIAELEEQHGEHLVGILNKDWKWGTDKEGNPVRKFVSRPGKYYPITFATFQALASKRGKKLRKKLSNYFGVVWCEEAHHESAPTFHQATRAFNSYYRGGQTATPSRKDQTHVAIFDTLGPVTARGRKEQMTPIVIYHPTNIHVPDRVFKGRYMLPVLVNFLARNAHYQEALYEEVLKECEEGRKILVVTERRNHAFRLQQKLKLQGFGCELMIGGQELKEQNWYAEELLSGRISVIIGTQVINENVNIPPLDSIHQPFPNFGKEREEQRVGRVRRYLSGANIEFLKTHNIQWEKPQPRVHIYTWHSSHSMAGSAVGFRDKLYKKWGFDFAQSTESLPKERRPKTMKEWLDSFKDDE